jgi:hypothetical protein
VSERAADHATADQRDLGPRHSANLPWKLEPRTRTPELRILWPALDVGRPVRASFINRALSFW